MSKITGHHRVLEKYSIKEDTLMILYNTIVRL